MQALCNDGMSSLNRVIPSHHHDGNRCWLAASFSYIDVHGVWAFHFQQHPLPSSLYEMVSNMHAFRARNQRKDEHSATSLVESVDLVTSSPQDDPTPINTDEMHLRNLEKQPYKILKELSLDLFFVGLSLPFLSYALTIMRYDGAPLQNHKQTADFLIQASHIVRYLPDTFTVTVLIGTGTNNIPLGVRSYSRKDREGIYRLVHGKR